MENIPGAPWAKSFKFSFINPHWNQWKILLELLGSIPSSSIMESLLEINGKYSKRFLGYFLSKSFSKVNSTCSCTLLTQFLRVPLSTRIRNLHKMLLELPGPIPLHFFIKSVLKSMVNALGACWSISLPKIIGKCSWSLLVRSFGPHPLSKSSLEIHEMLLEIHGPLPSHFLIKS